MNKLFVSIIVVFVAIGGLLLYQASNTGTSLVLTPSEVLSATKDRSSSRLRVAGRVSAQDVFYQVEPEILLRFSIFDADLDSPGNNNKKQFLPVVYRGLKPDMFAQGRDVILDGEYVNGEFVASKLLTQCPSKYEPPVPGHSETQKSKK